MVGAHCIKTWSATQGAYALSSAEAELYGMIEGVTRARGLVTLAEELGFGALGSTIRLGTDSSAAKSFVCPRGLGKIKHIEIQDLWLQKDVADEQLTVFKTPGETNPADLMTKVFRYCSGTPMGHGHLNGGRSLDSGRKGAQTPWRHDSGLRDAMRLRWRNRPPTISSSGETNGSLDAYLVYKTGYFLSQVWF